VLEGLPYGGTFLLGDRAAEGDGTVRAQFVGGDVGGVLGGLGTDADDAQGGGEFGQDGCPGADEQDPAALARGAGEQRAQGGAVLLAVEEERADAVIAVPLQIRVLVGLPGEVAPYVVVAVPFDRGGHGAAPEVLALGAAVDDVPAALQRGVGFQEETAYLCGEDRGRYVGG
jgi:hypothetical protein